MTNQPSPRPEGFVRKETLWTAIMLSVAAGFFIGVVFTIFKSSPPTGVPPTSTMQQPKAAPGELTDEQAAHLFELERQAAAQPNDPETWAQIGHVYFDSGNPDKAIDAYEKSVALKPDNADVLTDLGVMYRRNGKPEKAVENFDKAMAVDPAHQVSRFNKGIVLIHDLKDIPGGIAAWEALLKINPVAMAPNGQSVDELVTQFRAMSGAGAAPKTKPAS
ncbi:MAG: tetratricopeptide repeat protein [Pseudomonadota bacterium]